MINVMLCGAGDVSELLPPFNEAAIEIGFNPFNFTNGTILYHNYGINKWERNSRLTVNSSDILVFVINERFGELTWNAELEEAMHNGKNFLVLCRLETYTNYRFFKDNRFEYPNNLDNNKRELYILLDRIESVNQLSVIPFNIFDFKIIVKEHLMKLFKYALTLTEKENQKNSFIPILMSSKYDTHIQNYINVRNDKICKEILFDAFENIEMRKRALDYFIYSKSLSDEELSELCVDMEQGLRRKAINLLNELISPVNKIEIIFENVIPNIANIDDVGVLRRAIKSFINIDIELSLRYFNLFFPANDVGTPKRIIANLKEKETELNFLIELKPDLKVTLIDLVNMCINYNSEKTDWKNIANEMLIKYGAN
ncbi:MAG: hypothetical protein CVU11_15420 [Bacteroidetes bacterium HGW-Bacteroidetes-6]|jgi:hypothetical protein|nr:MAG: hypothetical protein CVU11_15420 [Bacteroidetes bacterium HGW-Bacteroidetes-6]